MQDLPSMTSYFRYDWYMQRLWCWE